MNEKTERRITFPLTDAPPVSFLPSESPILAYGVWSDHDGQVRCQANREWDIVIRVRQHADGRALVLGRYEYSTCWQNDRGAVHRAGLLLDAEADLPKAITTIGHQLIERLDTHEDDAPRVRECVAECIANLPAQEI